VLVELPLADHFRGLAATVERDGGVIYPAICRGVADNPRVLSLLDDTPLPQRRPLLLLAAVHFLLLSGVDHPLAAYYDTVAAVRGTPFRAFAGDVSALFTAFCEEYRRELKHVIATRTTQTNEVGRCTALLPGLCHIARLYDWDVPLSLLDLGTSAGLNLLFDDYAYTYRSAANDGVRTAGKVGSPVSIECSARDDVSSLPELRLPTVDQRVGLDLSPLDPFSDDDVLWLLACQWPDNPTRFGRLRGALSNVRASHIPPRLEQGDMVTDLPRVAASTKTGNGCSQPRSVRSAQRGPSTTSIARRRSKRRAFPRRPHRCRAKGPTWPPRLCTSAPRASRCGLPTLTRMVIGSAGGPLLVRAPRSVSPSRHLDPLLRDVVG
jgi:hypothetical protein